LEGDSSSEAAGSPDFGSHLDVGESKEGHMEMEIESVHELSIISRRCIRFICAVIVLVLLVILVPKYVLLVILVPKYVGTKSMSAGEHQGMHVPPNVYELSRNITLPLHRRVYIIWKVPLNNRSGYWKDFNGVLVASEPRAWLKVQALFPDGKFSRDVRFKRCHVDEGCRTMEDASTKYEQEADDKGNPRNARWWIVEDPAQLHCTYAGHTCNGPAY